MDKMGKSCFLNQELTLLLPDYMYIYTFWKHEACACAEEERNNEAARKFGVDRKCSESYKCHPLS